MRSIQRPNQYLRLRHDVWHYVRRVPKSVRHIDERVLIYRSLETDSRKVARQRRDICAAADDQRWSAMYHCMIHLSSNTKCKRQVSRAGDVWVFWERFPV